MALRWIENPGRRPEHALAEVLTDEAGTILGTVERFFEGGPSYAQARGERSGAMDTDEAARAWCERAALLYADALARQRGENLDGSPRRECIPLHPSAPQENRHADP